VFLALYPHLFSSGYMIRTGDRYTVYCNRKLPSPASPVLARTAPCRRPEWSGVVIFCRYCS